VDTVRASLAYSAVILRQLVRDRAALFFLVVLPIAIIVIIGTVFGGVQTLQVGVVRVDDGDLAGRVVDELHAADGMRVTEYATEVELRKAVRREAVSEGIVIPAGFGADLRSNGTARLVHVVNPTDGDWFAIRTTVQGAVDRVAVRVGAAQVVARLTGTTADEALALVDTIASTSGPTTTTIDIGDDRVAELSRFALIAPQQLVLFVFVNSLGSAVALMTARRSGVLRRAFATRTPLAVLLVGLLLGWFSVALLESILIIAVGVVVFGVTWGDPLAAAALVVTFAAVGGGAGLLLGVLARNEDRVSAVAPMLGMTLGALGGCMVPLEIFSGPMLWVARLTPHYWAVSAWQRLVFDGEGIGAIAGSLGVLLGLAVVLITGATVALRRELTGA
jgi:ABC-2 type transport system permease protein